MKTTTNIFIAFVLNLVFSVIEFAGGIFTGSVAIISDAVHDIGDAVSIGISYFLERKSKRLPDEKYTYGYSRYSVIGGLITTLILLFGSAAVICNAVHKIMNPSEIHYNGMIIFAVLGVIINLVAALVTRDGESINQRSVNLHMLEDVLGWGVVLLGAIIMKFTDITVIDPLLSIAVAIFILINAIRNFKDVLELFLEKTPEGICIPELKKHLLEIDGVLDVHHIHVRSMDGYHTYSTMHIVTNGDHKEIKEKVRNELSEHGIVHATLELEDENEHCSETNCSVEYHEIRRCHHHHH